MNRLVHAARSYLGVRFRHRGRKGDGPGKGLDCAGLVWIAYRDCGVTVSDFQLYEREPEQHKPVLVDHAIKSLGAPIHVGKISQYQLNIGDVVLIRFDHEPHHVAIVTDYPLGGLAIIHADGWPHDGKCGKVIEHRLSPDIITRITHVFRRPV
jgi:cell wall-associated NlpC family hydrolase